MAGNARAGDTVPAGQLDDPASDPDEAARYLTVRDMLLPEGLTLVNYSYRGVVDFGRSMVMSEWSGRVRRVGTARGSALACGLAIAVALIAAVSANRRR